MTVVKRNKTYQYSGTVGGARLRFSLGTRLPQAANTLSRQIGAALAEGPDSIHWRTLKTVLPKASWEILTANRGVKPSPELSEFETAFSDKLDKINGGIVVNGLMFNKEQSAQVAEAHRQGRTIVTPGDPNQAIMFPDMKPLPDVLYQRIQDDRQRFMERFGVAGSTATGSQQEETVRGKIINGQNDSSRTGGGISEALEIAAARIYEQFLQFIYVYWDAPHWVAVAGPDNAEQMMQFQASDIPPGRKIVIKVQTGSMVPQDELSLYNEAMAEWEGGISDPLSYFEKTKDPNPKERATKLMMYRTNPQQYMAEYLQMAAPPAPPLPEGGGGSESGAPPNSTPPPTSVPSPVQAESAQLLKSVPVQ